MKNSMKNIYDILLHAQAKQQKLLAILLDPEKTRVETLPQIAASIEEGKIDMVLVGGSGYIHSSEDFVAALKNRLAHIPVVLFPGSPAQFAPNADALLLLSLISGRNAELLIGQHVRSAWQIRQSGVETIPTSYILIDGGKQCTTEKVSGTTAIAQTDTEQIVHTAVAGELLGLRLTYLEAGSGALTPVSPALIKAVREAVNIPLTVGGGICTVDALHAAFEAGADMVVVGNHFEQHPEDIAFFGRHKTTD